MMLQPFVRGLTFHSRRIIYPANVTVIVYNDKEVPTHN